MVIIRWLFMCSNSKQCACLTQSIPSPGSSHTTIRATEHQGHETETRGSMEKWIKRDKKEPRRQRQQQQQQQKQQGHGSSNEK